MHSNAFLSVIFAIIGVPSIDFIQRIYFKRLLSILRFPAPDYTVSTLYQYYTLTFCRYVWVQLCIYTRSDTCHMSLPHTTNYGILAAIQNCNKTVFSLKEDLRQQTFYISFSIVLCLNTSHRWCLWSHPIIREYYPFFVLDITQAKRLLFAVSKTIYTWTDLTPYAWKTRILFSPLFSAVGAYFANILRLRTLNYWEL